MRVSTPAFALPCTLLVLLVGCSGDPASENTPPTIADVEDETVIRNTLAPRSIEVTLHIDHRDDDVFDVEVQSSDESVVPSMTLSCGLGPCPFVVTPSPDRTAQVTLDVTVADGRGGEAQSSFDVAVVPRLVTNPSDSDVGSLRDAVLTADAGDVIAFDVDAVFSVPRTILLGSPIVLDKDLTIEGPGPDRVTVSGNDVVRVFEINTSARVELYALTVARGFAAHGGGVLVESGSMLTLRTAVIADNSAAGSGGGIFSRGTVEVADGSVVAGNEALGFEQPDGGGGVYNDQDGVLTIRASSVGDGSGNLNTARRGGGIYNRGTVEIVEGSRIAGNTAGAGSGGGIFNDDAGETTIRGSTLGGSSPDEANTADVGGGIRNFGKLCVLEDSRISGNSARVGAGIQNGVDGEAIVRASTVGGESPVEANRANLSGGGLSNSGALEIESTRIIGNSVAVGSGGGISNTATGEVTVRSSTIGGSSSTEGNRAPGSGGGVFNLGSAEFIGSRMAGNQAANGGGIYNTGDATIELDAAAASPATSVAAAERGGNGGASRSLVQLGSSFDGNVAEEKGGGVYNGTGGLLTLGGLASVTDNTALDPAPSGGGIWNEGTLDNAGVVSDNAPDDIAP